MDVKGTAFLARKSMLAAEFGEEAFAKFMQRAAARDPTFAKPVLATSTLPIDSFLALNDAIVQEFHGGDVQSLWRFGEKSADWSLTEGPYKHLRASKSVEAFAESADRIYRNYFTDGAARATLSGDGVTLTITGIPRRHRHVYFEYSIVGYFKRGLELVGAQRLTVERVRGFSNGDDAIEYRYKYKL